MSQQTEDFHTIYSRLVTTPITDAKRHDVEIGITLWRKVRSGRLDMEKRADSLKNFEMGLKSWIIEVFKEQHLEGMLIDARVTSLTTREQATVDNKEAFLNHIKATGELDLLQFRLACGAVDERRKEGVDVPGVNYIDVYELSDKSL